MRYLILSDIHSNLTALEAVLAQAGDNYDRVVCLGDIVGYGPDPNQVVDRVRALDPVAVVRGNHDKAG
ncbi:MAG: metallophosphoesterase family protein, partial [Nitrospiraceae bacterium]